MGPEGGRQDGQTITYQIRVYMRTHDLVGGSAWLGAVIFSISCKQSSKTLPMWGKKVIRQIRVMQGIRNVWNENIRTNVDIILRACLYPRTIICLGQLFPVLGINLSPDNIHNQLATTCKSRWGKKVETHDIYRSLFDPTITHGILLTPQKSTILSCTIWIMLNEFLEVME